MTRRSLRLDLVAARSEVARALDALRDFALGIGAGEDLAGDICLAADEALANAILHGYREDGVGPILLEVGEEGETITLRIVDSARPFDPLKAPPPKLDVLPEERKPGGLGIFLMRAVSHEVTYAREGERNHLTLRWKVPRE